MESTSFPCSEAFADLEETRVSRREKPLHAQFRRCLEEEAPGCYGVDVDLRRRGWDEARCFDLQVIPFQKETANSPDDPGAQLESRPFGCQFPLIEGRRIMI